MKPFPSDPMGQRYRFGGYFRIVDCERPIGIMPSARRLGKLLGGEPAGCREIERLPVIDVRPQPLNYRAWGFKSQAEMDEAFGGDG